MRKGVLEISIIKTCPAKGQKYAKLLRTEESLYHGHEIQRKVEPVTRTDKHKERLKVTKVESKGGVREGPRGTREAMAKTL